MGLGVEDSNSEIRRSIGGALVSPIDAFDKRIILLKILYTYSNRE